jgi:4-nitrophenyl phosphatase
MWSVSSPEPGGENGPGTVVCDLDGVLYLDKQGIPGAGEALLQLRDAGFRLLFVTNNSTKTRSTVVAHIANRTGFHGDTGQIITSAWAAAEMLVGTGARALVMGGTGLSDTLRERDIAVTTNWKEADAVVVGLDLDLSYRRLRDAALAIQGGARFIATNTDSTYPTPDGLFPGGGAMVAALETVTGMAPEVAGKPHPPMRDLIRAQVRSGPVWMVGDRAETDLALAGSEGWVRVLVLSGVTRDVAAVPAQYGPDMVLGSVAELPAALGV